MDQKPLLLQIWEDHDWCQIVPCVTGDILSPIISARNCANYVSHQKYVFSINKNK
jgi:hypothetical protein